jgi:hypothetical protein
VEALIHQLAIEHAMRVSDDDSEVVRLINLFSNNKSDSRKLKSHIGTLLLKEKLPSNKTPLLSLINKTPIASKWRKEVGIKPGSLYDELIYLENILQINHNPLACVYHRLEVARSLKEEILKN